MKRIVLLTPAYRELLEALGQAESLIPESEKLPIGVDALFNAAASHNPDLVICDADQLGRDTKKIAQLELRLSEKAGRTVKLIAIDAVSMDNLFSTWETVGEAIGRGREGRALGQRLTAQIDDWTSNFHARLRNKRVAYLSAVGSTPEGEPLCTLAARWIPDLIVRFSAQSMGSRGSRVPRVVSWTELREYRPDVIIVAPEGATIEESTALFKKLEKAPGWVEIPAAKRGEVIFTAGRSGLYRYSPHFYEALGVLCSAIAGLESGYIAPRDSFFRLRWLELHRHNV